MAKKKESKKKVSKKIEPKKSTTKKTLKTSAVSLKWTANFWQNNKFPALLLFALSIAIYIQSIKFDYVLDDKIVLNENGLVKKGFAGIGDILSTESMTGYFGEEKQLVAGGRYRPLSLVTFAIEHQLFGGTHHKIEDYWIKEMRKVPDLANYMDKIAADFSIKTVLFQNETDFLNAIKSAIPNAIVEKNKALILSESAVANPRWGHIGNVLLFAFTVLLLFRVLSIIFPTKNKEWYLTLPFIASLLFALHPIHLEVVANIKGRDEIMALLGSLAAMYFTLKYIAKDNIINLVLSGIIFFLGLMSKENTITYLAMIPLTVYFFTNASFVKNAKSALPLLLATILFLYIRGSAIDSSLFADITGSGKESADLMNNPFFGMSGSEKFATIFYTLGMYVKLLFVPHPLTHDYYPYQIPIMNWGKMSSIFSLLLYLVMGGYAIYGLIKKSIPAYAILLFLIPLSIVSNIVFPIGTFMNDRFIYFSSIGFCVLMAYWISRKLPAPVLNLSVLAIFVLGFALKSIMHLPTWENGYTLNRNAIQYSPNSARANLFMGTALFDNFYRTETDYNKKQELLKEITAYIDKSISIYPTYGSALTMLGGVAAENYKTDNDLPKLLAAFEQVIKIKKRNTFIETYLDYLKGRGNTQTMENFYHRIGYDHFYQNKKDAQMALFYLNMGAKALPNSQLLLQDIAQVRRQ